MSSSGQVLPLAGVVAGDGRAGSRREERWDLHAALAGGGDTVLLGAGSPRASAAMMKKGSA
jgi:hypothetical protein